MRLRMKTIYAGPAGNYQPGELAEFGTKEGKALVEGGFAEEIGRAERRSPTRETATPPAPQTATPLTPQTATPPAPETAAPEAGAQPTLLPAQSANQ